MKHSRPVIVVILLMTISFMQANAAKINDSISPLPVELKYAGLYENQPLLQLNLSGSKEENEFTISITDQTGLVLYSVDARGEKISKTFLLNEDLEDAVLSFTITAKRSGTIVSYQVRQKQIQQMDVVKL